MDKNGKIDKAGNDADGHSQDPIVDYSNVFTFDRIIRMPVEAVVSASIDASMSTYDFIKEFGFERAGGKGDRDMVGPPKMLRFFYRYNNAGVEQRMVVQIPVLSLITLPFLNIKKAKFDVGIEVLNHFLVTNHHPGDDTHDPIPIEKSEVFVLLGPLEKKGFSKEYDHVEGAGFQETRVSTNMQASIEVETMDMPAGILQMLNLMHDASSGEGKDIYKLHCKTNELIFDEKDSVHTLTVKVKKNGKKLGNEVVAVSVVSNTDDNLAMSFSKPIQVLKGNAIGIPTLAEAKALSDEKGRVKFKFTSKLKQEENQNGFIYFTMAKASKIAVYYQILKSKENEEK